MRTFSEPGLRKELISCEQVREGPCWMAAAVAAVADMPMNPIGIMPNALAPMGLC